MKIHILLIIGLFISVFISCNRATYYAWENNEGDYCTLEVKRYKTIYRASAFYDYTDDNIYLYVEDEKDRDLDRDNFLTDRVEIDFSNLVKLSKLTVAESQKEHPDLSCKVLTDGFDLWKKYEKDRKITFDKSESQDTIYLRSSDIIEFDDKYGIVKDSYLQKEGIMKFPQRMYKIKRVNYHKFPRQIQKLNLKYPYL